MSEYDERVSEYWKSGYGKNIVELKGDDDLEDPVEKVNYMPLHLGAFVLSNSKRFMNNFIHATNFFLENDVNYGDTDSLFIENKHWKNYIKPD